MRCLYFLFSSFNICFPNFGCSLTPRAEVIIQSKNCQTKRRIWETIAQAFTYFFFLPPYLSLGSIFLFFLCLTDPRSIFLFQQVCLILLFVRSDSCLRAIIVFCFDFLLDLCFLSKHFSWIFILFVWSLLQIVLKTKSPNKAIKF